MRIKKEKLDDKKIIGIIHHCVVTLGMDKLGVIKTLEECGHPIKFNMYSPYLNKALSYVKNDLDLIDKDIPVAIKWKDDNSRMRFVSTDKIKYKANNSNESIIDFLNQSK